MDYQRQYELLIAKHGTHDKPAGYSERHHIVPKSMGGSNDTSNLTYLSAKAHFVAHHLLWRWHRNSSMAYAFKCMSEMGSGERYRPTAAVYSEAKAAFRQVNRGKTLSTEHRAKLSKAHSGKPMTSEKRACLLKVNLGRVCSAETRKKMAEANSRLADVYCFSTGEIIAEAVGLTKWSKDNGFNRECLQRTARGTQKQHKGIYAQYTT